MSVSSVSTAYLKTTAALIKTDFVLNAAIRDGRLQELPTIKDQKEPIKFLEEEVLVNWQDGSEVIRITFKGHNPGEVKRVVDSVQQAFMKEVVEKDVHKRKAEWQKVQDAMDEMRKWLEQKVPEPPPLVLLFQQGPQLAGELAGDLAQRPSPCARTAKPAASPGMCFL